MNTPKIIWPKTIAEARAMQEREKSLIRVVPLQKEPEFVAGADAAFTKDRVYAAVCVYRYRDLTLTEQVSAVESASFPYVPGYLLFREGPALLAALEKLTIKPDVILFDAQGIAHPLGIGSASHLGVLLEIPTIGCAKTRLIGEFKEPGLHKGDWSELDLEARIAGAVLRTKDNTRPLFLSPGHLIDIEGAVRITLGSVGKYRIPEPLRCADMLSRKLRAEKNLLDADLRGKDG